MSMVINTNMGSENAVRLLDQTSRSQKTSMERLTSGLRINHTADDAAGKAVVTRMDSQVRGTDMAIRNSQDGINLIQTVDGATEEVVNMLQRIRELGIQAANDTYTSVQRAQMNQEVTQLKSEIDRVASTTKFKGINLMNVSGSTAKLSIHAGWETDSVNQINISLINMRTSALGISAGNTISTQSKALLTVSQVDKAISKINTSRAKWGATQNRFEHTIANLQNVNENIKNSRSQIQDADFARESANLARTQVLQQAGMSMLSQSNQQAQQVLQLLR
ncbi:flagellin N-terminal helical domain-containing protein [Galenea microaerophila]